MVGSTNTSNRGIFYRKWRSTSGSATNNVIILQVTGILVGWWTPRYWHLMTLMQHHACIHAFPPWLVPGSYAVKGDMIRQVFPKCGFLKHTGDWIRSYLVVFIQTKNLLAFIQSTKGFCWCLKILRWFNAVDKKIPAMPDSDSSDAEILLSMLMVKLAIDSPEACIEGIWIWLVELENSWCFRNCLTWCVHHLTFLYISTVLWPMDFVRIFCQHPGFDFCCKAGLD